MSGIAIAAIAGKHVDMGGAGWILLGGIAWGLYGLYIVCTRGSYWISSLFTYLVPIVVIVYLAHGGTT